MAIHVKPYPPSDQVFVERVAEAIAWAGGTNCAGPLEVRTEADLRRALPYIRTRFPDVHLRAQESIATLDAHRGDQIWYAFRDHGTRNGA